MDALHVMQLGEGVDHVLKGKGKTERGGEVKEMLEENLRSCGCKSQVQASGRHAAQKCKLATRTR